MLSHHEIREELIRRKQAGGVRPVEIQKLLDLPSSRVAEILRRDRQLKFDEAVKVAEFLGIIEAPSRPVELADVLLHLRSVLPPALAMAGVEPEEIETATSVVVRTVQVLLDHPEDGRELDLRARTAIQALWPTAHMPERSEELQ